MKLILAQGNPGPEYTNSRHNVGFMALDALQKHLEAPDFQQKTKFQAQVSEYSQNSEKVILAKPTTFYNLTGQSARALCDFYKIAPQDVLVIHDELALDFATLRVRLGGSDAGNKGIRSLSAHIGPDFWRIRVGIHNELAGRMDASDFVLSTFGSQEKTALVAAVMPDIIQLVEAFIDGALKATSKHLAP